MTNHLVVSEREYEFEVLKVSFREALEELRGGVSWVISGKGLEGIPRDIKGFQIRCEWELEGKPSEMVLEGCYFTGALEGKSVTELTGEAESYTWRLKR